MENASDIKEYKLNGYSDIIKSKKIVAFAYHHSDMRFECYKLDEGLYIKSTGGNKKDRDKTAFKLEYTSDDYSLLNKLQKIIEIYYINYNNGYVFNKQNISKEIGDSISVTYDSSEAIYKASNIYQTIPNQAIEEIYDIFHEDAIKNGYDFNYKQSNVPIYDDATEEFLQGKWEGTHLGNKYLVIFEGKNIRIFCNNNIQDDCQYIIIRGSIRRNIRKKEIPESEYDFEEFNSLSCLKKKGSMILYAYFGNEIEEFKRIAE